MIDILLVNPKEHADLYMRVLLGKNLTVQIVQTPDSLFNYPPEYEAITTVPNDVTYKSAIAWNKSGQLLINSMLPEQVLLHNLGNVGTMQNYITAPFDVEDGQIFNIVSYKGRHILIDVMLLKDGMWNLAEDQNSAKFTNTVETVFEYLDTNGILNGPSQIFVDANGPCSLKLTPSRSSNKQYSTRNFLEIWSLILGLEETNPKKALNEFYGWVTRTGPSKKFQLLGSMSTK